MPRPHHGQPGSSDDPGRPIIAPRRQIMRPHSFQFMPTCAVHTALARAHGCTPGCRGSQLHGSRKGAGLLLLAPYTLAARTEKASKCKAVPKNAFCRAMLAPSTLVWCSRSRSSPWQRLVKDAEKEAEGRCKSYGRAQRKAYLTLRYVLRKSSSKKLSPHSREPRSLVRHPPCWWCPGASCMPHVTLARRRMPPAVRARAFAA